MQAATVGPAGEAHRSDVSASTCQQLNGMLREKGWQPSDAQVCELARLLADHVPAEIRLDPRGIGSDVIDGAARTETLEPEKFSDGLRKRRDRGTLCRRVMRHRMEGRHGRPEVPRRDPDRSRVAPAG